MGQMEEVSQQIDEIIGKGLQQIMTGRTLDLA
jgi:hypothetical protein